MIINKFQLLNGLDFARMERSNSLFFCKLLNSSWLVLYIVVENHQKSLILSQTRYWRSHRLLQQRGHRRAIKPNFSSKKSEIRFARLLKWDFLGYFEIIWWASVWTPGWNKQIWIRLKKGLFQQQGDLGRKWVECQWVKAWGIRLCSSSLLACHGKRRS